MCCEPMSSNEKLRSKLELRLDWGEQDIFGHVNNVAYFKYIQAGRVNFWESMPNFDRYASEGIGPMLASAKCDFKRPLFYPGQISVETTVDFLGSSSFGLRHEIKNGSGEISAIGADVIVYYDFNRAQKMPLEEITRQYLSQYLNQEE